jgi:hypothetical protein
MAEFSREWVEKVDPTIGGWDFDLAELFSEMPPDSFRPLICEGYGFRWIEVDSEGRWWCGFGDDRRVQYHNLTSQ